MKSIGFIGAILIIMLFCQISVLAGQTLEDVVYLKSGSVIRGSILEQIPGQSLKIQTKDGNIFVYKYDDITKITKEPIIGQSNVTANKGGFARKNPAVAFVLSWLVPGAGQVYNNQPIKGAIQFGVCLTGYILFFTQLPYTEETYVDYGTYSTWIDKPYGNGGVAWTGFGVALGCAVWSMIDAPVTASRMNREGGLSFNEIKLSKNLKIAYSPVDFQKRTVGPNIKMQLNF